LVGERGKPAAEQTHLLPEMQAGGILQRQTFDNNVIDK
jgi:hypothetical protein